MNKIVLFTTLITLTACSKKKDDAPAPADKPTTGAPAAPQAPATGAPAAPAADGKFTCDTILSKAVRDKYFANHKIENVDFPVKHSGKCKVTTADGKDFEINAACAPFMKNAKDQTVEVMKKQFPETKELPNAGELTLVMDIGDTGLVSFTSYNKGSFCMANGTLPKAMATSEFFTEWLASLPTS
jgi:hypothetical protein